MITVNGSKTVTVRTVNTVTELPEITRNFWSKPQKFRSKLVIFDVRHIRDVHHVLSFAKYIDSKNAFKTVLACLEAKIINFLCFEAFGRCLYGRT